MKERELKLSHEYLLQILEYFPDTGIFVWKIKPSKKMCVGQEAGTKHKSNGYYYIGINKTIYARSRLAWFYVHGVWPKNEIDHRNRIRDDDRIENLREATHQQNNWNKKYQNKKDDLPRCIDIFQNKFRVALTHENKRKHLGLFISLEDAIKCRDEFEMEHRGFLFQ